MWCNFIVKWQIKHFCHLAIWETFWLKAVYRMSTWSDTNTPRSWTSHSAYQLRCSRTAWFSFCSSVTRPLVVKFVSSGSCFNRSARHNLSFISRELTIIIQRWEEPAGSGSVSCLGSILSHCGPQVTSFHWEICKLNSNETPRHDHQGCLEKWSLIFVPWSDCEEGVEVPQELDYIEVLLLVLIWLFYWITEMSGNVCLVITE